MHFHRSSLKTPSLLTLALLLGATAACQSSPAHAPAQPSCAWAPAATTALQ